MTASADPVSTAPTASSDAQLIAEVRAGDNEAYARLFERHHTAAVGLARRYARNASDAEDLASEGFANVLTALRSGSGPDAFFRAYLFTSISRLAARGNIKANRQTLSDEMERYEGEQLYDDPVMAGFESDAVANAFRTLPERWQAVLWYTEVDGMQPAAVAPLLGLSPNAVSALALRAREGLRQAYLQAHVSAAAVDDACAPFADKLGAYTRNGLSARKEKQVREHLADCPRCTAALLQLEDVGHGMRGIIFPLVTALPFAAPAAGKLVAGGLLTGGAAWLKRTADKVGPANLVVIGVAAVTVLAGGIAFAGLGQPTAQGPPAAGTAPGAAASSGTGSGGGSGAGAAKEVAPTPLPPSPAPTPEDSPEGPAPGVEPAPAPASPPAEASSPPSAPASGPATAAPPGSGSAVPSSAPSNGAPPSGQAPPTQLPSSSQSFPYTLSGSLIRTSIPQTTDKFDLKVNPANRPAQKTESVVTVRYRPGLSGAAPVVDRSSWSCAPPSPADPATGNVTVTCTSPYTGGPIDTLSLSWPLSAPSISATAVLMQGSTPASNELSFPASS